MKDERTLAFINLFAVLAALEDLARLDKESAEILSKVQKPVRLGISVRGGPAGTLAFENGACRMERGVDRCDIKLPFANCSKFNGLIDGTVTPIPCKGFTKIGFLLGPFKKLTDRLNACMRADEKALSDPAFYALTTEMLLFIVARAACEIANGDEIGRFSASNIVDGDILLRIAGGPAATIHCKDHSLSAEEGACDRPAAVMEFADTRTARQIFDGKLNAVACIGLDTVRMGGMISMLDNLNRLLDRVSLYLA